MESSQRQEAIRKILRVITSRMAQMSTPMCDEAIALADELGITARELIDECLAITRRI